MSTNLASPLCLCMQVRMKWGLLSRWKHVGYGYTVLWCQLEGGIFALKMTGALRSKCRQDFHPPSSWHRRTVYPIFRHVTPPSPRAHPIRVRIVTLEVQYPRLLRLTCDGSPALERVGYNTALLLVTVVHVTRALYHTLPGMTHHVVLHSQVQPVLKTCQIHTYMCT